MDTVLLDDKKLDCTYNKSNKTITLKYSDFMEIYKASRFYKNTYEYKNKINLGDNFNESKVLYKSIDDFNIQQFCA
jgi:hypothetical protein